MAAHLPNMAVHLPNMVRCRHVTGFHHYDYYTVLFGIGRAYGVLAQLFWDR